jgi:hypothetical protein
MFGSLGWSSGPAKLVHWPLQLKTGTAADFTCQLCLKNKSQRKSHITLGYLLVQYHFALHPPFNLLLSFLFILRLVLYSRYFYFLYPDIKTGLSNILSVLTKLRLLLVIVVIMAMHHKSYWFRPGRQERTGRRNPGNKYQTLRLE